MNKKLKWLISLLLIAMMLISPIGGMSNVSAASAETYDDASSFTADDNEEDLEVINQDQEIPDEYLDNDENVRNSGAVDNSDNSIEFADEGNNSVEAADAGENSTETADADETLSADNASADTVEDEDTDANTEENEEPSDDGDPYEIVSSVSADNQYVLGYESDDTFYVVTNNDGDLSVSELTALTTATVDASMLWTVSNNSLFSISNNGRYISDKLEISSRSFSGWDYALDGLYSTDYYTDANYYALINGHVLNFYEVSTVTIDRFSLKSVQNSLSASRASGSGAAGTHYLAFASDRHSNTTAISSAMSGMPSTVEYVSLIGDMVNGTSSYSTSTVLSEVTSVFSGLSSSNVSIIYGSHDQNANDDAGILVNSSGLIYTGYETDGSVAYYIYAVSYSDMGTANTSSASTFKSWVDTVDQSIPIIVVCHRPIQVKRNDNSGAQAWTEALNYAATGVEFSGVNTSYEITRDVILFGAHNHTVDGSSEYFYLAGDKSTLAVQGSSSVNETLYFTYITAGYLNANKTATLVGISSDTIYLTKYKSGSVLSSSTSSGGSSGGGPGGGGSGGPGGSSSSGTIYGFDTSYARVAKATSKTYTITFADEDGTVLDTQTVAAGETPVAPSDPTKAADEDYVYTFAGWSPEITAVTENATYTATYTKTAQTYTLSGWSWTGDNESGYTAAAATFKSGEGDFKKTVEGTVTSSTTAATCTEDGSTVYTATVIFENETYTDTKSVAIAATGHDYGDPTYAWSDDNSSVTATAVCKNDSSHVLTETVETTVTGTNATCTVAGATTYTATFDNSLFTTQTKTVTGEALGHDYVAVITAPTCTEDGYTTYTCSRCGDTYKAEETAALGHIWNDGVVTKEATATEEGVKTYTCTVCGETKTETIPKLEEADELKVPEVSLDVSWLGGKKIKMTANVTSGDGYYEVTGQGFVYMTKKTLGSRNLTVSTSGRTRVYIKSIKSDGSYSYTMTSLGGTRVYAIRAYIIYTDTDGNSHYVYTGYAYVDTPNGYGITYSDGN